MKEIMLITLIALGLTSCKDSVSDLKIEEINSACECIDATRILIDEMADILGNNTEVEIETDGDLVKRLMAAEVKSQEVTKKCDELGFSMEAKKSCDSYDALGQSLVEFKEIQQKRK